MKTKVLVTGANGQLGQCLQSLKLQPDLEFTFFSSSKLDVSSKESIKNVFNAKYDFCINCAAYTAVDKAESEKEKANLINNTAVESIAKACKENDITLIHISTDFVFNGEANQPYNENNVTDPISVYGKTKLEGENAIKNSLTKYYIIRTSWLYSQYGNNFLKSMLNLAKTRDSLNIVNDQIGTPTYALDLAKVIVEIINNNNNFCGLYHYSNNGVASWFDFAKAIFTKTKTKVKINPIPTSQYPTAAKRPHYSVLDKSKIINTFGIEVSNWEESLDTCLKSLH